MTDDRRPDLERLSAHLDGALPPAERAAVERDLRADPALRREFDRLRRLRDLIRAVPAESPSPAFYASVRRRAAPRPWTWAFPPLAAAAAAALVLVMVHRDARRLPPPASMKSVPPATEYSDKASAFKQEPPSPAKPAPATPGRRDEKAAAPAKEVEGLRDRTAAFNAANRGFDAPATTQRRAMNETSTEEVAKGGARGVSPGAEGRIAKAATGRTQATAPTVEEREADASYADRLGPTESRARLAAKSAAAPSPKKKSAWAEEPVEAKDRAETPPQWRGDDSAIQDPRTVLIDSPAQWKTLWIEHGANRVPPPAAPAVDFDRFQVVGVFLGARPSGGYGVDIVEIADRGEARAVLYRESRPPRDEAQIAVMTSPFHLRVVPRSSRPARFQSTR